MPDVDTVSCKPSRLAATCERGDPALAALLRLPAVGDNAAMQTEPPKADPPKRKRRWFQFSLRTLMIVVTLLAVPCAYVGWQAKIVSERRNWLANPQFVCLPNDPENCSLPWIRRLFGDTECIFMIADDAVSDADLAACRSAFPELDVRRDKDQPTGAQIHFRNGTLIFGPVEYERDHCSEVPAPTWQPSLNQTLLKYEPLPDSRH